VSLEKQRGQKLETTETTLGGAFYPFYQWVFGEDSEFVKNVERKLAQARMADNVEMFLSRALAVGLIAGIGLWILGMITGWLFVQTFVDGALLGIQIPESLEALRLLRTPLIVLISGILFGTIGFIIGFGSVVSIPYFRAGGREREINTLMPDGIAFMYALSVGGMNQLEILRAMAKADDTYGELSKEFQSIVLETEYFDTDYRTAVRNQALETPSDELAQFLTDMLSILDSGGNMTDFLEDQKDKHLRTAKQEQKKMLDTLELFGEMYMTLSLFPLLLIIILVIMNMMGNASQMLLYGTVYGLIPLISVGFLVLVSTVTQDTIGDGYLEADRDDRASAAKGGRVLNLAFVEQFTGEFSIFDRIKQREGSYQAMEIVRKPHLFFRDNPTYILVVTIPISVVALIAALLVGWAPVPIPFVGAENDFITKMADDPVRGTFFWVYMPMYINFIPLAIFYEWNQRYRKSVIGNLSENLRKLASANDTGMTLLESVKVVSDTSSGRLSDEFETIYAKVNYGTGLKDSLREFNNKFHVPRMARTVKLISEAQEASSQIQDVLNTAAQASENQDDIERDRKSRTRMQTVIIIMTFLTLLGVIALLKVQFLDTMAGLSQQTGDTGGATGQQFGGDLGPLSMLFFHAVTLQAIMSSFIAGYIRDVNLISGVKYAVILSTISLAVWISVSGGSAKTGEDAATLLLLAAVPARSGATAVRERICERIPGSGEGRR